MNTEYVSNKIQSFMVEQLDQSGQDCFVVGVSGGVDSAVVAALCSLTGESTAIVNLPEQGGLEDGEPQPDDNRRANALLDQLDKFSHVTVGRSPIDPALHGLKATVAPVTGRYPVEKTLEMSNAKCRIRMAVLYFVSNAMNGLVVGTDNAVESYLGFYTKGGDGVFDINPMGDLLKTDIWEIARYLGVPDSIVEAEPTDGLWSDGRTDEEQIGATYSEVESVMLGREDDVDQKKVDKIKEWHKSSAHKREPAPVCNLKAEELYE